MKKYHLKSIFKTTLIVALTVILSVPAYSFAARTSAPVLTGLFPSTSLSINLPAPSISLGNSTTTGSVFSNGGSSMYFEVTALDGVGESLGSQLLGTSTVNEAHGWKITWSPIQGASGYRVYFSTSTPQTMTQYFTATTTNQYTFTSTSSPTFIPGGIPTSNSAYTINLAIAGNSWLNGGKVAVGTTTPSNAHTTIATSTIPQLALLDINGNAGWSIRSINNNLYVSTTTASATSSLATLSLFSTGQMQLESNVPTAATSTGSGTGSVPIAIKGTANFFNFSITTGSSPTGSNAVIATFTLPSACANQTVPVWSDANSNTNALAVVSVVYASSTGASTFNLVSGATGLTGATQYAWNFQVGCY